MLVCFSRMGSVPGIVRAVRRRRGVFPGPALFTWRSCVARNRRGLLTRASLCKARRRPFTLTWANVDLLFLSTEHGDHRRGEARFLIFYVNRFIDCDRITGVLFLFVVLLTRTHDVVRECDVHGEGAGSSHGWRTCLWHETLRCVLLRRGWSDHLRVRAC